MTAGRSGSGSVFLLGLLLCLLLLVRHDAHEERAPALEGGDGESTCVGLPLPERCRYLLGLPLDLNRAGPEEMTLLPGIGPGLAGRIHAHRQENGPFRGPEDLLDVPGIGSKTLDRIRDRVAFGPA